MVYHKRNSELSVSISDTDLTFKIHISCKEKEKLYKYYDDVSAWIKEFVETFFIKFDYDFGYVSEKLIVISYKVKYEKKTLKKIKYHLKTNVFY